MHRLHLLTAPTHVVWGAQDPLMRADHAGLWTARIPHATSAVIAGGGHLPYVEDADAVVESVDGFAHALTGNAGKERSR